LQQKQVKAESKKYYARFLTSFLFILAMLLMILGIELYRRTVIAPYILIIVIAFGAIVGLFLLWKQSLLVMNKLWATVNCCATGGAMFYYFFLLLNYHFANPKLISADFEIVEFGTLVKGRKSSCGRPYFYINFNGTEKQLVFRCNLERSLEEYISVNVVYRKGLFGFEYIVEKNPIAN
jgi:hypothetical protein